MKVNKILILLHFLFIVFGIESVAQNTELIPLDRVLHILEQRFNVVFTFADENIKEKSAILPQDELTLQESLLQLENQTNLHFIRVNARFIAIQNKLHDKVISGTIVDQSTKEYLSGALIYVGENYALSDSAGQFAIKVNVALDSVLIIQHMGYESIRILQKDWAHLTAVYELVPDYQLLDEVVVNYIASGITKLKDGTIQLNVKNLEVLPGLPEPDILHGIQVLPGIQSINESIADLNTRGGTNDQNLVLWDGVKMYQTGHFFGLISAFNSHLVHQTKIIKNGTSAAYDEGISGTIDLKQQDYLVNDFEVSAGINMISTDVVFKVPVTPKLSLIANARTSINNLVETPTYKSYFKRTFEHTAILRQYGKDTLVHNKQDFSFYDFSCKLLYDATEKDNIRLSILTINDQIESKESAFVENSLLQNKSHLEQSSLLSNLVYNRSWSKDHSAQVSTFISGYNLDGTNVEFINDQYHHQKNEVLDWGLKLESKNTISRRLDVSSGYQFNEIGIRNQDNILKPDYNRDEKDVLRIHALYSELKFKQLFERIYLRLGLRANYFTKFNELTVVPRIAMNVSLNQNLSLEFLAEKKSQHTTQLIDYQTDFLGIEKRRWVLSNNTSVPLLHSQQYSLGLQYNKNNLLLSVEGYLKNVTGIITPSQGFLNQFQYVYATGEYNSNGLEVLVNKRFSQSNLWINYALSKNDYQFKELIPPTFPNNYDIRHTLSIGGSYTLKRIELAAGINYRTGQPYTRPAMDNTISDDEIEYEMPNSSLLKDYLRFDISAKYHFNMKRFKGELGFSVWNLLNRENTIHVFYRRSESNEIEQIKQKALGITPNVNMRILF